MIRGRLARRDERGIAMVLTIGVAALVLGAAMLAADLTNVSITGSSRHVRYEQELHLAEQGIDQALARLQEDETYHTTTATPPSSSASRADHEAFAVEQALAAPSAWQAGVTGTFAVVKPALPSRVIYAIGWDPTRTGPAQGRVLKVEYLFSTYNPEGAVVSNGNLTIQGGAKVTGEYGDVHSNGNISILGAGNTVEGEITASGSIGGSVPSNAEAGSPQKLVPPVEPEDVWALLTKTYATSWYDLCGDGTIRRPIVGGAPCANPDVVFDGTVDSHSYRGWRWGGSGVWIKDSSYEYDGVYYIDDAGADIRGPGTAATPWKATVIAGGTPWPDVCRTSYGDIVMTGNPYIQPFVQGLALVAGRDLKINGTSSYSIQGVVAAHEQVEITGNATLSGSLLAENACDSPGSPVTTSLISGSMTINYDTPLDVQLGSLIRTSLWLEL